MARMLKHAVPARTAVACGSYDLNKEMQRLRIFGLYSHPGNGQAPWKWAGTLEMGRLEMLFGVRLRAQSQAF